MSKGDIVLGVQFQGDVSELNRQIKNIGSLTRAELQSLNAQLGGEVVKKLVIRTETDATGAKKQVAEYKELLTVVDTLTGKQRQLDKLQPGSVTSLRQQVNEAKQARDQISKYEQGIGRLGGKVQVVSESWVAQNQKVQTLQRSLDLATASGFWDVAKTNLNVGGLVSFSNGLTQITNGLQAASIVIGQVSSSINGLINSLGMIQSFKLSFEAIGQGAGGAGLAMAESSRAASGLGVNLNTVRDSFKQLTPVVTNSGGTIGDVSNIVEALSSRFAAFGISGDKARRVTNGITQAFAKGKLMAEELTQQISEADPAFKTDFANAIGVSVKQLEALVKAGKITSEVLIKELPKIGKSGLLFGKLGISASDAANSLATAGTTVDQFREKINTINQLSLERFSKSIEPLLFSFLGLQAIVTDFLQGVSRIEGIKSLGEALGSIGVNLTGTAGLFLEAGKNVLIATGAIAQLVDLLFKIPGLAEIVSLAITAKIISSLTSLAKGFSSSGIAATSWGKSTASAFSFANIGSKLSSFTDQLTGNKRAIKALEDQNSSYARKSETAQNRLNKVQERFTRNQEQLSYLQRPGQITAPGSDPFNVGKTRELEKEQGRLKGVTEKLNSIIASNGSVIESNKNKLDGLSQKTGLTSNATKAFSSAIKFAGGAATAFASALGPVGAALLAISVLTSAYSNANEKSNQILDESKQRVDALKQGITDLNGPTAFLKKPTTGLALAWDQFSYSFAKSIDTSTMKNLKDLDDRIKAIGDVQPIRALSNAIWTLFNQEIVGAQVQTEELGKTLDATVQSTKNEANAIIALTNATEKLSKKGGKGIDLKVTAAIGQAQDALEFIEKRINALKGEKAGLLSKFFTQQVGSDVYNETLKQIKLTDQAIKELNASYELARQKADAFAASQGFLTSKQKETVDTTSSLGSAIKAYQEQLQNDLSPDLQPEKWAEVTGQIVNTQYKLDKLNTTGATIAIRVIEEAGVGGVAGTLSQIDLYIQQLNLKKVSIPIGSSGIDEVITKINYANMLRDAGSRTSAELEKTLAQSAFDYRLSRIKQEQDARNQIYDDEIARLQGLGPAEEALRQKRTAELREKAASGDLEAQAQLERIAREEKITELRKEQSRLNKISAEEVKTIEAQQAAIIKAGKEEELRAVREVLEARKSGISILEQGVAPSVNIANQMSNAADSADRISQSIRSLDGFTANINVTSTPARWAGGPTTGGQTYQVNEIGQEGFLSSSGRLSAINKPRNALWRAPSSGTVIPAHIWSDLNVPAGGVSVGTHQMPAASGGNGFQRIIQAIRSSLSGSRDSSGAIYELASVQARQALEIGKLSHAVNRLADKDQSVNVSVRNTGSTAYLEAVNRRI